jgi:anti-sigma factor RsiW
MARDAETPELRARELADLSALADGTLDPARRDAVRARITSSHELSALYERERRVADLLREARATDRAPEGLRRRIEAKRPSRGAALRSRMGYGGAFAGALAAIVLALVLILPAGTPGAPSVSQAAALGVRAPTAPAPAPDPSAPAIKLGRDIQKVYFPNWSSRFHWRAVGQRSDRLNGRLALTVYYQWHGHRIAYTIVSAPVLASPAASVKLLHGTELRTLKLGGRLVVTWRRAGHTCVLSGVGIPAAELQLLAAWDAPGLEHGS